MRPGGRTSAPGWSGATPSNRSLAPLREWARVYQTPVWLTAAFIALLVLFAITPEPAQTAAGLRPTRTSEPTPGPRECVVCGIDQRCDPGTGRCIFVETTPLPCVEGSKFDEKAGFCLPTGEPRAPAPRVVEEVPEETAEPEQPQQPAEPQYEDPPTPYQDPTYEEEEDFGNE